LLHIVGNGLLHRLCFVIAQIHDVDLGKVVLQIGRDAVEVAVAQNEELFAARFAGRHDLQRRVAAHEHRVFVLLFEERLVIHRRLRRLAADVVDDLCRSLLRRADVDLVRLHPADAGLRVDRAVEVRGNRLGREGGEGGGRVPHRREQRLIAVVCAEGRPVVVGAVEDVFVLVILQRRLHVDVFRAAVLVTVVDDGFFTRGRRVFRQQLAVDLRVAGHERKIDRHGRVLRKGFYRRDVGVELLLIGRVVLFQQRAAGAEIDVLVLLLAARELAAGLERRPGVAERELVGDAGLDLVCVFAAEKALGAELRKLLQLAVFTFGKALVRQKQEQRQPEYEEAAEHGNLYFECVFCHGDTSETAEVDERIVGRVDQIAGAEHERQHDEHRAEHGLRLFRQLVEEIGEQRRRAERRDEKDEGEGLEIKAVRGLISAAAAEAEHGFVILTAGRKVGELKEHPAGEADDRRVKVADERGGFFEPLEQPEFFENEEGRVVETPEHEVPARAVPEAGQRPDDRDVQ